MKNLIKMRALDPSAYKRSMFYLVPYQIPLNFVNEIITLISVICQFHIKLN